MTSKKTAPQPLDDKALDDVAAGYKYKLQNVLVSSYQTGGSAGGDLPRESFSMNYTKI